MRNATAYGVSPRIRFDLVVNNLTAWAHATGEVLLKSDGTPWRPIVHIEDIARAFLAVTEAPRDMVHMESFNVGSTEQNHRVMDIARMVAEVVPNTRIVFAPGAGPDPLCYRVNCDKLLSRFPAARPRWTARQAAEQLYGMLCATPLTPADFEGPRYARRPHVEAQIASGRLSATLRREAATLELA
jgi:nucleoside-diphosphate-sugar epimerase